MKPVGDKLMDIPDKIKNIRIQLFLNQTGFAKRLGITRSAISSYERGINIPNLHILKKIMEVCKEEGLEFNIEDFLEIYK